MWKWLCETSGLKFAVNARLSSPPAARLAEMIVARQPSAGQAFGNPAVDPPDPG
jgi:hypothetical protein